MDHEYPEPPSYWRSPAGFMLLLAAAVGGFYLVTEHTAHLFGVLPFLLILACPLMHVFIVALFAEMYGFPLTIYLLSGWLGPRFPNVNLFGHDAGHLWWLVTGQHGNPHFGALHILSFVFLFSGFTLLSKAWHVLYHA